MSKFQYSFLTIEEYYNKFGNDTYLVYLSPDKYSKIYFSERNKTILANKGPIKNVKKPFSTINDYYRLWGYKVYSVWVPSDVLKKLNSNRVKTTYRHKNKQKHNEYNKKWHENNPDYRYQHRQNNKERYNKQVLIRNKNNPIPKLNISNARRAKQKPDKEVVNYIKTLPKTHCVYCNISLSLKNVKPHLDHKTPLARGGNHEIGNLQWTCSTCNQRKWRKTDKEFRLWMLEYPNKIKIHQL